MIVKLLPTFVKKTCKVIINSKRFLGSKRGCFILIALSISVAATNYILTRGQTSLPMPMSSIDRLVENRLKEFYLEEKGKGCEIPKLDPFSAEAMKFIEDFPKITCQGTDWVMCHKSECYVKKEILKNMTEVSCSYRDIVYVNDHRYFLSNATTVRGSEKYMLNKSDHVRISCTGRDLNSFPFRHSQWSGLKVGFRPVRTEPIPPSHKDSYNVMILGFDSASHNGFIRKMPKSYRYLTNRATILNGQNILGFGTPAALFALLTGVPEHENVDARKTISNKVFVDHTAFLFHKLKKHGYLTAFFEDMAEVGTFVRRFNGFLVQPADHYIRPVILESRENFVQYYSRNCFGDTPQYQMFMNLTNEFLQLEGKKFIFTMMGGISHENFNQIATADEDVVWFLESLAARRVFEDTLVIVLGDHGARYGNIRESYQGKLEERLPFVAIFLPEKLKKLRPKAVEALTQNVDVLTTILDIHATVLDVLDLKHKINKYKIPGSDLTRSMTLLEPIPKTRTCAEAGIVQHWCSCTKWFNVSEVASMYKKVANALAEYIDSVCEEQRSKCVKRKLLFIHYVLQHNVNNLLLKYGHHPETDRYLGNSRAKAPRAPTEYYQAKIVMSPGQGVFEGTLTYHTQTDSFWITQKDVSRTNRYGTESECIIETHPHLDQFCYCKHQRPNPKEIDLN